MYIIIIFKKNDFIFIFAKLLFVFLLCILYFRVRRVLSRKKRNIEEKYQHVTKVYNFIFIKKKCLSTIITTQQNFGILPTGVRDVH